MAKPMATDASPDGLADSNPLPPPPPDDEDNVPPQYQLGSPACAGDTENDRITPVTGVNVIVENGDDVKNASAAQD